MFVSSTSRPAAWAAAIFAVTLAGCGSREAEVHGVVKLNGNVLDHGNVTFLPVENGAGASANIASDGSFTARTGNTEGLKPGEYIVTVRASGPSRANPKGGPPIPGKLITPIKYSSSTTTDLRATIKQGDNELVLELTGHAA